MKAILTTVFVFMLNITFAQSNLVNDALATWDKHVEMNKLLFDAVKSKYLADTSSSGGRSVGEQFAHMHNVRMMWLGKVNAIDEELDAKESQDSEYLSSNMRLSDRLTRTTLEQALNTNSKIREMSAIRFMGYLISHESHTRGQILLALKQSGHPMPPQVSYGIWEW